MHEKRGVVYDGIVTFSHQIMIRKIETELKINL